MTPIEFRAEKFASTYFRPIRNFVKKIYIKGATDQKAVDDEQYRKDMQYVGVKRQELVDKAIKAHCYLCSYIGTHGKCVLTNDPDKCEDVIHIKKFLQQ